MNLRSPVTVVGLFLALFWVFGLMLALDRVRPDETRVLPSLDLARNYQMDRVVVQRTGKDNDDLTFVRGDGQWSFEKDGQHVKIEASRINKIVDQIREARRDDETAVPNDPAAYGLKPPQLTIALTGKPRKRPGADEDKKGDKKDEKTPESSDAEKTWTINVGNDSVDKKFVYVSTPERPNRIFAVRRQSLENLFFDGVNDLRPRGLFRFSEPTVQSLTLKDGAAELEAKKQSNGAWLLVKPNLGYADFEGPPPPKDAPPFLKPAADGGLKSLIAAVANLGVVSDDDFVAPAADVLKKYDLAGGQEKFRIQVSSGPATKPIEETMLVGKQEGDFYYARMMGDDGVFKVRKAQLEPLLAALKSPAELRSRELSPISMKECDAVVVAVGKDEAKLTLGGDPKGWHVALDRSEPARANNAAVESLLSTLQGKRAVLAFKDVHDADVAKVDRELGFDQPQATVSAYVQAVEGTRPPKLKKDAKPAVTWVFGKTEGDRVWVKRTMPDGPAARFAIDKAALEKIVPREGLIGFGETTLPRVNPNDVVKIEIDRGDKSVTLERKNNRWVIKDASGESPADLKKAEEFARRFSETSVERWVRKIDVKDDLERYGLKSPGTKVTLTVKQDQITAQTVASALAQLGNAMSDPTLNALGAAWGNLQLGAAKVTIKFGKEATEKDDAGHVYVHHSKSDRLSIASIALANLLREADFRDRLNVLGPELYVAVGTIGTPALQPLAGLLEASPLATCKIGRGDASSVRDLTITVRTPYELRTFSFVRKDTSWVDQTGLKEFQASDARVNEVANLVARLDFDRIVQFDGGAKADQKLTPKDAMVVIHAGMADRPPVSLTIGANFEGVGFFANTSAWPGAVFMIGKDRVLPMLRGTEFFAKERAVSESR